METAILMAAGLGTRMLPITETIPKPLVKVHGTPMIETIIEGLKKRNVAKIYIVVGYLKEQFFYLKDKYQNIEFIENNEFETVNNISSIRAADSILGKTNCFICEADLYIFDQSIFKIELKHSCYFGKMVNGYSEDWIFDVERKRITRIGKTGSNKFNMVGISYFKKEDAEIIRNAVKEAYNQPGYQTLYWDEVINQQLSSLYLEILPVKSNQIIEIDSVKELQKIDSSY